MESLRSTHRITRSLVNVLQLLYHLDKEFPWGLHGMEGAEADVACCHRPVHGEHLCGGGLDGGQPQPGGKEPPRLDGGLVNDVLTQPLCYGALISTFRVEVFPVEDGGIRGASEAGDSGVVPAHGGEGHQGGHPQVGRGDVGQDGQDPPEVPSGLLQGINHLVSDFFGGWVLNGLNLDHCHMEDVKVW